jgi:CRP/FNR family transcriptional activator FtrB
MSVPWKDDASDAQIRLSAHSSRKAAFRSAGTRDGDDAGAVLRAGTSRGRCALPPGVGLFGETERDEALVEIFGPGDAFIVPAVALDMVSLLTARMLDEGRILMWPAASFRTQVRANVALAYGAMLQLSSYWRMLVTQIKELKLLSAVERLSALLLSLAPRASGPTKVVLPGSRGLVAGLLGVAPQSLSRAFSVLRPIGVTGSGREISITDTARLREIAGPRALKAAKGQSPTRVRPSKKRVPRPMPRESSRKQHRARLSAKASP